MKVALTFTIHINIGKFILKVTNLSEGAFGSQSVQNEYNLIKDGERLLQYQSRRGKDSNDGTRSVSNEPAGSLNHT